jgi:hypothetical protein
MVQRKKVLEAEVIPAWNAFLRGLLQGPSARSSLAASLLRESFPQADDDELTERLPSRIAHLNQMAKEGSLIHPTAQKSWLLARALRRMGHKFCAGPLVLYAASHLSEFVAVMALAEIQEDQKDVLLEVIDSLIESATAPVSSVHPETQQQMSVEIMHLFPDDIRLFNERSIWWDLSIPIDVNPEFESAWVTLQARAGLPDHPDIDAAVFAASTVDAPLAKRRRVVVTSLRRYFMRNETTSGAMSSSTCVPTE